MRGNAARQVEMLTAVTPDAFATAARARNSLDAVCQQIVGVLHRAPSPPASHAFSGSPTAEPGADCSRTPPAVQYQLRPEHLQRDSPRSSHPAHQTNGG